MFQDLIYFSGETLSEWEKFLKQICSRKPSAILLLVAEETLFNFNELQPLFQTLELPVWGGIFPEIIVHDKNHKKGVLACTFKDLINLEVIPKLDSFDGEFTEEFIDETTETLFILTDGFADQIPLLIESLYEISKRDINYIGGGAGSLNQMENPSLFTADKFFARGAIIASISSYIAVGTAHGWNPVYGPALANEVEKRVLKSINWEPAFDYYKKAVDSQARFELSTENFNEVGRSYPFGLLKYDNEIILRVPLGLDKDKNILLGSEIGKNSMLMVMECTDDQLVQAAAEAAIKAKESFINQKKCPPQKAILIDCITRAMHLGSKYNSEVEIVAKTIGEKVELFGFLSLGEISSIGDKYIELLNKSVVVGIGK